MQSGARDGEQRACTRAAQDVTKESASNAPFLALSSRTWRRRSTGVKYLQGEVVERWRNRGGGVGMG